MTKSTKPTYDVRLFVATILGLLFVSGLQGLAETSLLVAHLQKKTASKIHETWEGTYVYADLTVVRVKGQKDLYVTRYVCPKSEGNLIDFFVVGNEKEITFLQEAVGKENKGVTPVFQGVDVFVSSQAVELIVRWRHPGNGGLRTVEKYTYDSTNLWLVGRTEFLGKDGGFKWVNSSEITSAKSAPSTVRRARIKNAK